jgi:hypothetical protein
MLAFETPPFAAYVFPNKWPLGAINWFVLEFTFCTIYWHYNLYCLPTQIFFIIVTAPQVPPKVKSVT